MLEHNYISVKKIKLDLNSTQKKTVDFWFRKCCRLYNVALEEKLEYYRISGKYLNKFDQKKELVDIKEFDSSWKDVPNKALTEIIIRLDKTFQTFFKGAGFPKFQSNRYFSSIYLVEKDVKIKNGELFLPKIKTAIKCRESLENIKNYSSVRIIKENEEYYISFTVKEILEVKYDNSDVLGVDLGLIDLFTTSTGLKQSRLDTKLIKHYNERIKVLNQSLSQKKKGSLKFKKVKKQLGKTYKRLKNSRHDYLHKASIKLLNCKESVISVGDIKIQKIVDKATTSKGLIKSFYTTGVGLFKQIIEYKQHKFNKKIIWVQEFNTSKKCHKCGTLKKDLTLSTRTYECKSCGISIDRDLNSSLNHKSLGLSSQEFLDSFPEISKEIINYEHLCA